MPSRNRRLSQSLSLPTVRIGIPELAVIATGQGQFVEEAVVRFVQGCQTPDFVHPGRFISRFGEDVFAGGGGRLDRGAGVAGNREDAGEKPRPPEPGAARDEGTRGFMQ